MVFISVVPNQVFQKLPPWQSTTANPSAAVECRRPGRLQAAGPALGDLKNSTRRFRSPMWLSAMAVWLTDICNQHVIFSFFSLQFCSSLFIQILEFCSESINQIFLGAGMFPFHQILESIRESIPCARCIEPLSKWVPTKCFAFASPATSSWPTLPKTSPPRMRTPRALPAVHLRSHPKWCLSSAILAPVGSGAVLIPMFHAQCSMPAY